MQIPRSDRVARLAGAFQALRDSPALKLVLVGDETRFARARPRCMVGLAGVVVKSLGAAGLRPFVCATGSTAYATAGLTANA